METNGHYQPKFEDLSQLPLEQHVEESIRTAIALAGGQPINARHALMAVLFLGRKTTSEAFEKLSLLLPLKELETPEPELKYSDKIHMLSFDSSLDTAYSVAEPFLSEEKTVLGRDYITMILLAVDPSLKQIAEEADSWDFRDVYSIITLLHISFRTLGFGKTNERPILPNER